MTDSDSVGCHLIADMTGVSAELLRDGARIMAVLDEALRSNGFRCLKRAEHSFEGRGSGFTGMILLAESHAAVHTYPELEYLALDIFACGQSNPAPVLDALTKALSPADVRIRELLRPASNCEAAERV